MPSVSRAPGMDSVGFTATPSRRRLQPQYDEEMDWSPITTQHRALNDNITSTPTSNRFGHIDAQTPSHPQSMNPFRFKVPAAPVEPARRLRNPAWLPAAKQEPPETGEVMFTRREHQPFSSQASNGSDASGGVEFKQPSFFAPQRDHDTSSLADLLNQSFSLGQEQELHAEEDNSPQGQPAATHSTRFERATMTVLLAVWLLAMFDAIPFAWHIQLSALSMAGVIALRGTGATRRLLSDTASSPLLYILSALGVAELTAICWVGLELWSGPSEQTGWYGAGILASMLLGPWVLSKLAKMM